MTISDRDEGMDPMLKPLTLATLACALWAETALANCVPPASTYFACTLRDGQKRVEFCQGPVTDGSSPDYYSYNFADGSAVSELYFTTDAPWISTKYFRGRGDNGTETLGMALEHEGHCYAFYITGIFGKRDGEGLAIDLHGALASLLRLAIGQPHARSGNDKKSAGADYQYIDIIEEIVLVAGARIGHCFAMSRAFNLSSAHPR